MEKKMATWGKIKMLSDKKITHLLGFHKWDTAEQDRVMQELVEAGEKYVVLNSGLLEEGCKKSDCLIDFHSRLKSAGLEFLDAHAPWGVWADPGMPVKDFRDIMLCRHKIALNFCRIFGVTTLAFHTGNTTNHIFGSDLTLDDYYKALIEALEELLPVAEKCNVIIALENQWTPLNHSSVLLQVMEYFNSPNLGLCYDSGHGNLTEKGATAERSCVPARWKELGVPVKWEENLIEKFQPWLVNCHLTDNFGMTDEHLLPGKGNVDWSRIKRVLAGAERLHCIQNECRLPEDMSVTEFCKGFRAGLGKL